MNTSKITSKPDSLNLIARMAGFAFLTIVIGYTLSWTLVYAKLIVAGNATVTAQNILQHETLFRMGISGDLIIGLSTLVLSWALFILLKTVNSNLALLAFCFRMVEAILAIFTVSISFISLQILTGKTGANIFKSEQLQSMVGLILNLHTSASTIPMVFTGLGSIIFFYLLLKSRFVPDYLSGFGIFSYLILLIFVFIKILAARPAEIMTGVELFCYLPSVLFELVMGMWLLLRGLKTGQESPKK